jgi:alanyl-tRNA synthetase
VKYGEPAGEHRYLELWNLVFMQYERMPSGARSCRRTLPKPSIDTGAGLERMVAVLQGKFRSSWTSDCFTPIIARRRQGSA